MKNIFDEVTEITPEQINKLQTVRMRNGVNLVYQSIDNPNSGHGLSFDHLHPKFHILHEVQNDLESVMILCLEKKGFRFENRTNFLEFIKNRCTMIDHQGTKQRIFSYDGIPFLAWSYNSEFIPQVKIEERTTTFTATFGSFTYL